MGFLDGLLKHAMGGKGDATGLGGLVGAFRKKGPRDLVSGWISTGPDPPISAALMSDVLGEDALGQFASKAGVPVSEVGSLLAALLPAAIDHLTPDGKLPETNALENALKSLVSGLGR